MAEHSGVSFDFEKLQKLVPAGREDLATLAMLLSAGAINHPAVDQFVRLGGLGSYAPAAVTAAGALLAYLAADRIYRRVTDLFPARVNWQDLGLTNSPVHIRSDVDLPSPEQWSNWDGILLGYCVDSGKPIIVDWDHWMRHCFIVGQSGVGKTVLGEWLMFQQIVRGGSLLFVDGKMDEGNLRKIHAMACWAGRRDDLLVVNPGKPELSNTYNPILYGDPDEVASRIISLIPSAENNPGADHYRQQATQAVTTVVNGIKSIAANAHLRSSGLHGLAYNFFDLSLVLQNQHALEMVLDRINRSSDGGAQFLSWLEQFKTVSRDGVASIDMKKMKDTFGGIGGRLHAFGTGKFGEVTSSYSPEVNLFEALTNNKIVYIALPTMGKAEAASNFGKMVVGDYRTAVSWIQDIPKSRRPWPPTLCFFDEAGSYVTPAWSRIFEQARSAHQVLVPAVQTMANLDAVSKELRAMVIGNTWTKVIFKLGEADTIDAITKLIGKEHYGVTNVSYGEGASSSVQASSAAQVSAGSNQSKNITMRQEEGFRVKPTTLSALGKGEAIVLYGNTSLYHIKIPMLEFTDEFYSRIGGFEVNRIPKRHAQGLDFRRKLDRFITE